MASFGTVASASDIDLWVDADLTAYLRNNTDQDISFDGYQIISENEDLNVAGWDSLSDRQTSGRLQELSDALGFGALGFGEMSPTSAQVAEANISGVAVLKAGAMFSLGKPFLSCPGPDDGFFMKIAGLPTSQLQNEIVAVCIPEPSAWLLAALGATSCLAAHRSRAKSLRPL
jgi:hypothetical protein